MGGYGSGRKNYQVKRLVEDSLKLSIKSLAEGIKMIDGIQGAYALSNLSWSCNGKKIAEIDYKIYEKSNILLARLSYQVKVKEDYKKYEYSVEIQHTEPNFGGKRYWFTCPLIVGGKACLKRVGKLYLPPGSVYFGCRECHDLVYLSSRESHRWDSMWLGMGIDPRVGKMVEERMSNGEW